ncbi:MAG: response regulator [Methylomonas sp.]|jgi:FixJ family two-component response regulator|uniref:response regulator transcription factor n=1 Tax=Methylomonas sp. TaxID=418 RepID=UPI0025FBDB0F|nr:response regulator [Methylomonas sp.]MCK9606106.1 response regulator [Methylomonas sp.]
MTLTEPTIYLVDDDPSVLKALARLLGTEGFRVEAFACPQAFLSSYDPWQAGCLVLDLTMPGLTGMEVQQRLNASGGHLPIVFLTGQGDIPTAVRAIKAGAMDFLTKPILDEELFAAIRAALAKNAVDHVSRVELGLIRDRLALLTPRETEVLKQVVAGKLNKQIAAELGTVEKTIKVHRARVMQKMQAKSLAELVRLTEQVGLAS